MKRLFISMLVIGTLTMGTIVVSAQQGQRIVYETVAFNNVAGNNVAAYIDAQKNIVGKIIQERMKTEQILGWTVYQVVYRGLPASEYNFATVTAFSGPPTQAAQGLAQRATGMSPADLGAKLGPLATNAGNMLNRLEAGTNPVALQEGNITTVVTWKIAPQRGADYGRYVQNMLLPLNAQGVKDGRFLSWGAVRVVSPGGADAPFDALTATNYKDLASALPATPPEPNQGQMNFLKAFPNGNFSAFVDQGREVRRNVRTQMFRVVTSLQRPATTSSR
jgi:hypothetical protein